MYKPSRIALLIVIMAFISIPLLHIVGQEMDSAEQIEQLITSVWNEGDVDTIAEYVSEDVTVYLPPSLGVEPPFAGLEGYTMNVMGWRAGLPDMMIEVVTAFGNEEAVAVRGILTGTQTEEFFGIPATDAELVFGVNVIYILDEDGLIVEEWWEWDTVLELVQLGLFTPPSGE